jgi:cytidylate kinase
LKLAEDADFVDTTGVPVEQVVQRVLTLVHAKLGGSDSE